MNLRKHGIPIYQDGQGRDYVTPEDLRLFLGQEKAEYILSKTKRLENGGLSVKAIEENF